MSLEVTLIILSVGVVLTAFSNWKSRQKYVPGELPLLPYNGLQFVGMIIVFVAAAHLITIFTGVPFTGRMG